MGNCVCSGRQEVEQYMMLNQKENKEPESVDMVSIRGCSHCRRSVGDWTCPTLGSCSCPRNASPLSSCVFYSSRIQDLHEGEKSELETTQQHWTQVDLKNNIEVEKVGEENCKYYDEVLVKHPEWGDFFAQFEGLVVGDKIGEGGQAEIFAATMNHGLLKDGNLVKGFQEGCVFEGFGDTMAP